MKVPWGYRDYKREYLIEGNVWELKYVKKFTDPEQLGECCPSENRLSIKYGMTRFDLLSTAIHEVLHAIEAETDIEIAKPHREGDAHYVLSDALARFILDNFYR